MRFEWNRHGICPQRTPFSFSGVGVLAVLLLVSACTATLASQQPPNQPPNQQVQDIPEQSSAPITTLTLKGRLVILDVVVKDKAGKDVDDLTQSDFTILEDAQPQRIRSFEPPDKHILPPDVSINSTAELDRKAPDSPIDIIVLDEFNTRFSDMDYARYSIKKYLAAQPARLAQPTELVAVSHNKFQVLHDYTQDGAAILASLNKHLSIYPWELVNTSGGQGTIDRLALSLGALEQVAEATKGHPGHKNVLWVGHGFPGINTINLEVEQTAGITGAIQRALDMLRDARITLYTIDPTAVSTSTVALTESNVNDVAEDATGQDPFTSNVSFTALAKATGGKSYYSRNDVDREIGTSVRDGANFYSLSYTPGGPGEQASPYRHITIKLNRPGLRATTLDGYYPNPPPVTKAITHNQVAFDINSAASNALSYDGLHVEVAPVSGSPGSFILTIAPSGLSFADHDNGTRAAEIVIETVSFGAKDKYLRHVTDGVTIKQPADAAQVQPARIKTTAAIPPGTLRLRFVVRDSASGRIGTADYTLH
jgi:VWFA-related protein